MKQEGGFFISEVLVALGFMAVILVAVASLFISTAKAIDEAGEIAPAVLLARQTLEETRNELRLNPEALTSLEFWNTEYTVTPWKDETVTVGNEEFRYRVFTSNVRDNSGASLGDRPENLLKKVRIEVTWRHGEGRGYGGLSHELVSLVAR